MDAFERFDKRRPLFLVACLIGDFISGLFYAWSVLQNPFIRQMGGEAVRSAVVLCYTITAVSSCTAPCVFGSITKRLGTKKTILIGALLFGFGYIVSGRTSSMILFFIFFGFGTGIGCGFIYPTIMGYMASAFPDKRGSISGAVAGVYGGASIIWSPLLAAWIEGAGLGSALLIVGIIALVCIGIVSFVIEPVPEGYHEYKCQPGQGGMGAETEKKSRVPDLTRGQMVKTSMFYIAIFAFSFGCTSGMMVISQVSTIMQEGFSLQPTEAALYVSLASFMSMTGRFLWGFVADHFNKYVTLSIICFIPIVAMGSLVFFSSMPVTVACLAFTALCYGGFGSTITPITADLFGAKHVAENFCVMFMCFGFSGLVGPQIAANLRNGGDYTKAYLAAAIISVASFALAMVVRRKVAASRAA